MNRGAAGAPRRIYAIADAARLPRSRFDAALAQIADAGIGTIQIRAKSMPDAELWRLAEGATRRLEGWGGSLWIDDRVDLACCLPFDGVHLGQLDLPPGEVRHLLPEVVAIALSTHDAAQVDAAQADEAVDWVAVGPVFATASKARPDPVIGVEGVAHLRARTDRPLIAIGGIDAANLGSVLRAGADSVAVISAVCDGDLAANCRRLLAAAEAA